TTDPEKVSLTIRSRTQHLEFHLLPADELEQHVRWVIADAGLQVDEAAIDGVLRQGRGSARDTLSALDQAVAAGGVLPEGEPLDELVEALAASDTGRALTAVAQAVQAGRDARTLTEHLVSHLRDAFLSLMAPELVQLPPKTAVRVTDQARRLTAPGVVRAMEVLGETLVDLRRAPDPRLLLEVALVRLTNPSTDGSWSALAARVDKLERAAGTRGAVDAGAAFEHGDASAAPAPGRASTTPRGSASGPAEADASAPPRTTAARPDAATPAPAGPGAESPAAPAGRAVLGARARRTDGPAPSDAGPEAASPAAGSLSGPAPPSSAGTVTRDQLTLVWADQVMPRLKPMAKALLMAGRFADGPDGRPVLVVPNAPHRTRALEHLGAVESVLTDVLGQPVRLTIVTEDDVAAPSGVGSDPAADDSDEAIDLAELVDAPTVSPLDRVATAFPGAELFDED
ncbi:MAG TPA: hypothetical protein VF855_05660, partial [Acidimicrobiales bacterium]